MFCERGRSEQPTVSESGTLECATTTGQFLTSSGPARLTTRVVDHQQTHQGRLQRARFHVYLNSGLTAVTFCSISRPRQGIVYTSTVSEVPPPRSLAHAAHFTPRHDSHVLLAVYSPASMAQLDKKDCEEGCFTNLKLSSAARSAS